MAMILRLVKRLDWKDRAKSVVRWDGALWVALIIIVLLICITLLLIYWEDLRGSQDSLGTTIRTVALVIGGMIAVILAMWRSRVAERQATTAQQGLLNERYQKGAEMLGSAMLSVRMGGIYALQRLAEEHREQYHVQVMRLFCVFARHPTRQMQSETPIQAKMAARKFDQTPFDEPDEIREDVQAVMEAIGYRSGEAIVLEKHSQFKLDLRGADIRNARLNRANLAGADFTKANLRHAHLVSADLSNAVLWDADLSSEVDPVTPMMFKTLLDGVNLCGANLMYANLSGARLQGARLCHSNLFETNLSSTFLYGAKLISADISLANLSGAILKNANISDARLCKGHSLGSWRTRLEQFPTTRLTQAQLDTAFAESGRPPQLNGVLDNQTDLPLIWHD